MSGSNAWGQLGLGLKPAASKPASVKGNLLYNRALTNNFTLFFFFINRFLNVSCNYLVRHHISPTITYSLLIPMTKTSSKTIPKARLF